MRHTSDGSLVQKGHHPHAALTVSLADPLLADARFTVDRHGQFLQANDACAALSGYSTSELLQMSWMDLCAPDVFSGTLEAFREQSEKPRTISSVLITRSGNRREVEITGSLVTGNAGPVIACTARDITGRKSEPELRQMLKQQEHFLDRLTEVTPSVIYIFDLAAQRISYLNSRQSTAAIGYTAPQLLALGDRISPDLVHPDDAPRLLAHFARFPALSDRDVLEIQYRMRHRDGTWRWFDARETVFSRDAAGAPTHIIGCAVDITERRRTEAVLQVSEERYRRLSECGLVGVAFFTTDGRITDANDEFLRMVRFTRDDLALGRIRWDRLTPPEWLPRTLQAVDELQSAGRFTPYEKEYLRQDGTRFWGLFGGARLDRQSGGVAFVIDITERKRAEATHQETQAHLNAFFESAAVGAAQVDAATRRYVLVNDRFCQITGYSREELLERTFSDLTHPDDRESDCESYRQLVAGAVKYYQSEKRFVCKNGTPVWVQVDVTAIRDAAGRVYRTIGVIQDITARKNAEDALHRAKEAAEAGNRAKDHFLAVLSHELRTPLTPVLTAAQMLAADESLPAAHRDTLHMIARNISLEARLIDDLLDLTRITRGKLQVRKEAVNLHEKIGDVVGMLAREVESKELRFFVELAAPGHTVEGDPARLQQIIWNLLTNAIKFTPVGGAVRVNTRTLDGRLQVSVADTGIGVPSAHLPHIFDAFEQGGESMTRRFGGLGLGLAITRALVEMHGGEIRVTSDGPDRGTEFTFELPLLIAADAPPRPERPAEPLVRAVRQLRILLVEDHADTRRMMGRLLAMGGAQVTTAGSVAEARACLIAAMATPFDLLVCDIGLPDGTGLDVVACVKDSAPDTWCLALSGYGMEEDVQRSLRAGFDDHLTKPVDLKLLQDTVARITQRH